MSSCLFPLFLYSFYKYNSKSGHYNYALTLCFRKVKILYIITPQLQILTFFVFTLDTFCKNNKPSKGFQPVPWPEDEPHPVLHDGSGIGLPSTIPIIPFQDFVESQLDTLRVLPLILTNHLRITLF